MAKAIGVNNVSILWRLMAGIGNNAVANGGNNVIISSAYLGIWRNESPSAAAKAAYREESENSKAES